MRILLACLVALAVGAPAPAAAAPKGQANTGVLVLSSQTEGAEVYVDGKLVGKTPLKEPLALKPGKYTLKMTKRGYTEYIDVFAIRARKETKLDIDLLPVAGVLRITANVQPARIFVDGKFVGETPLEAEIPAGARTIKVTKGGYKDLVKKVDVVAGQPLNLDLTLEELPADQNPFRPPPPKPLKWYERWWVWTVIAGGATALALVIALPSYYLGRDPVDAFGPQFCWGVGVSCR
ncbi:MAG: PEGA domain-containing protein [Deltaproteobacteria bacterium]|nr:PEGA domain-containing protein [Deltaproteobacteria bacterium]